MPKKKDKTGADQEEVQNIQNEFTKEQILASAKYHNRRDLIDALLDKDKKYTIGAVEKAINDFMKGKVK